MRACILALMTAAATTAPAAACEWHEGGYSMFGSYLYSPYETSQAAQPTPEELAERAAQQEQAMLTARAKFLARFDVKPGDAAQLAQASLAPPATPDADPSPRSDAPDR